MVVLGMHFCAPPRSNNRDEFTLVVVIHMHVQTNMALQHVVCLCD